MERSDLIRATDVGGVTVLDFAGRTHLEKSDALPDAEEIVRDVTAAPAGGVVVSLEGVTFLSSRYLGFLVALHRKLDDAGNKLHLAMVAPELRKLLGFTKLDTVIPVHDSLDEAVEAAGREARP